MIKSKYSFRPVFKLALLFAATAPVVLLASVSTAAITYSDGMLNVINSPVTTAGEPAFVIEDNVTLGATTVRIVDGGELSRSANNSSLRTGVRVDGTSILDITTAASDVGEGVFVTNTGNGAAVGIVLNSTATAQIAGLADLNDTNNGRLDGIVVNSGASANITGFVDADEGGNGDARGLRISGGSVTIGSGGTVDLREGGSGTAYGADLSSGGSLVIESGGLLKVNENGDNGGIGVRLDSSSLTVRGEVRLDDEDTDNAVGIGIQALNASTLLVENGIVKAVEANGGDGRLFDLRGSTTATIDRGTFTLNESGNNNARLFDLTDTASVTVLDGDFTMTEANSGNSRLFEVSSDAQLMLWGGSYTEPGDAFRSLLEGNADAFIYGSMLKANDLPIADAMTTFPASASPVDVTGFWVNGSPFSLRFNITGDATLTLISIPEPSTWALAVLGLLGLASYRRRSNADR